MDLLIPPKYDDIFFFDVQTKDIMCFEWHHYRDKMTYQQFCDQIKDLGHFEVEKVAHNYGYQDGRELMKDLGYEFDENDDMFIMELNDIHPRVRKNVITQKYIIQQRDDTYDDENVDWSVDIVGNEDTGDVPVPQISPPPPNEVHIFDGDASKLHPGMYVQIATGVVHALPSIPIFNKETEQTRLIQQRAGKKYQKKLKKILELDGKKRATMETNKKYLPSS